MPPVTPASRSPDRATLRAPRLAWILVTLLPLTIVGLFLFHFIVLSAGPRAGAGVGDARTTRAIARARAWLWTSALVTLGALAAGAVLAPPATASPVPALIWLLFLGSSVHVAATGYLFTLPGVRAHATAQPGPLSPRPGGPDRPGGTRRRAS